MESKVVKDFIIHFYSIYSPSNKLSYTTWIGSKYNRLRKWPCTDYWFVSTIQDDDISICIYVIKNKNFHLKYSSFNILLLFWNKWVRFLNFQQLSKFNYFIFPARSIARESCWRRYSWLKSSQIARRSSIFIR